MNYRLEDCLQTLRERTAELAASTLRLEAQNNRMAAHLQRDNPWYNQPAFRLAVALPRNAVTPAIEAERR